MILLFVSVKFCLILVLVSVLWLLFKMLIDDIGCGLLWWNNLVVLVIFVCVVLVIWLCNNVVILVVCLVDRLFLM